MILTCNSCDKKFVVPDNAIGPAGRMVQCSSCGNKWKQFPVQKNDQKIQKTAKSRSPIVKTQKTKKKRKINRKPFGPSLYSPEYLSKKHGIKLKEESVSKVKTKSKSVSTKFGFYNYLVVYSVTVIFVLRLLFFTENMIINKFPLFAPYLEYLFESLNNLKTIIQNFFSIYS